MTDISEDFRWVGVELRHLVALKTVADTGSLAGAARRLGYSQPAVSQQIATLERLVGSRLVDRRAGAREVALTEAGVGVLRHADAILGRAQLADAELRTLQDGTSGTVRLGTNGSVGARIIPRLLQRFKLRLPGIGIDLVEDRSDDALLDRLESGQLDLCFAFPPLREGPFESLDLLLEPYVLLVALDSPVTQARQPLQLHQLEGVPLIVCSQSRAVDDFCRAHGIAPSIHYRIEDNETLVGLAAAGVGAAILPSLAFDPTRRDVVPVELAVKPPPRIIAIARHRDTAQTEPARALIEEAGAACAEIAAANF